MITRSKSLLVMLAAVIACAVFGVRAGASPISGALMVELQYKPEHCAYCSTDSWCELRGNGKWQCRGCKVVRYFEHFLYPPIGYNLMSWTEEVLRALYGTIDPQTGLRRYRRAYISVGKQNGKSFLSGGLPIYHIDAEDELDPQVYGAAAAKDQAGIVFDATAKLIRANFYLMQKYKVNDSVKKIFRRDKSPGSYQVLSADGDVRDGYRGSLLIRDEIHRWKTVKAETLRDVLVKGQISRKEPLDIQVTTAGAEYESPMWWREYQFAKLVQADPTIAPDYYVYIREADARRVEEEKDYWKTREARVAANPSHEDLGGHLKDAAIVAELNKAIQQPAERSKYLRYHLNIPIQTHENPVIDLLKWQQCGGGVDLRTWDQFDLERLISEWSLAGQRCFVGVDASWTTDLTAAVFVFPPFEGSEEVDVETGITRERWTFLPFFWVPEERAPYLERICRMPFASWIDRGFLHKTHGGAIDLRSVLDRIRWGRDRFDLRAVPYDRMNFRTEALNLLDDGIEAVEVPQNFSLLSYPTKFLLSSYPERLIRHGNHPALNWMAACLQLQYDHKDNCQPTKPERLKSSKRIDGMQAIVTALAHALGAPRETSVYSEREMRFL